MRKKAWLFLGCLILLSVAGVLLRVIELRTALDLSTMLMDFTPASLILLILSALTLGLMGWLARKGLEEDLPRSYNRCFGGIGALAVSAAALVLAVIGALLLLRSRSSQAGMRLFQELLALLAAVAGAAWLALGLDGWRKKKEDSFLSAVLPVFFCGVFLILFYKTYAQLPALRYTLYPFLGLCAALAALHLIAGFTLGRVRPRLTLFLCGAGSYLCVVALPGVRENAFRLFLGAIALELAYHGVCLLLPHPPEPEGETKEEPAEALQEAESAGDGGSEEPSEAEAAGDGEAQQPSEAEAADAEEKPAE